MILRKLCLFNLSDSRHFRDDLTLTYEKFCFNSKLYYET